MLLKTLQFTLLLLFTLLTTLVSAQTATIKGLVFDENNKLYASFGDRHQKEKAQNLNSLHGKIVRLNDDGSIPNDNPFGPNNSIYSYGHRNPQGLDIHPVSKKLFDTEHGPSGYDAPGGGVELDETLHGVRRALRARPRATAAPRARDLRRAGSPPSAWPKAIAKRLTLRAPEPGS